MVERNRKAGQNPTRVVAPNEEEEEEDPNKAFWTPDKLQMLACEEQTLSRMCLYKISAV
jgi:hypothetical protein